MILGIGTDIMNMENLKESSVSLTDSFCRKIYTEQEQKEASSRQDPHAYYCTRFAAKEAVFKAFRTWADTMQATDLEILTDPNGAPYVRLYGKARDMAGVLGVTAVHVSLSYDPPYAAAFAVLEG